MESLPTAAKQKSGVNALSLGNPGLLWLVDAVLPRVILPTIISIHASSVEEMQEMVRILNEVLPRYPLIIAVEVNLSCPNVPEAKAVLGILEQANRFMIPVIAKIGYQDHYRLVAKEAALRGWIQGISAINTVPWADIFDQSQVSPIKQWCGLNGGVSGRLIKNRGVDTVRWLSTELNDSVKKNFLIIGLGGIFSPKDASDYLHSGATHIAIGTAITLPIYWLGLLKTIGWLRLNQNTRYG